MRQAISHLEVFPLIKSTLLAIAISYSLLAPAAGASDIYLHLVSKHFLTEADYNEVNPGIGYVQDKITTGVYKNSLGRLSTYLGAEFKYSNVGVNVGGVTGYRYAVSPMIAGFVDVGIFRVTMLPVAEDLNGIRGFAVGLSIKIK